MSPQMGSTSPGVPFASTTVYVFHRFAKARSVPPLLPLLILTIVVVVAYTLTGLIEDDVAIGLANACLPAILGAACLWTAYRLVRNDHLQLWSPLPWFLAAWAVYHGFGPLVYIYGNSDTVAYLDAFYPVAPRSLHRTNLLNAVGLGIIIASAHVLLRARQRRRWWPGQPVYDPRVVAWLFLAVGLPSKYLLSIPYLMGLTRAMLPGVLHSLQDFVTWAIVPLTVAAAYRLRYQIVLWTIVASEVVTSLFLFSKFAFIRTVLVVTIARTLVRPLRRTFLLMILTVAFLYALFLVPFVSAGRAYFSATSSPSWADFKQWVAITVHHGLRTETPERDRIQQWWSRICLVPSQVYAMEHYDDGLPGKTLSMAPYVLIPRILMPEKPILSPGLEFTWAVRGTQVESSTALGIFGEAYWNGGWTLVILISLAVGVGFAVLGNLVPQWVTRRDYVRLPIIVHGLHLAWRIEDWFVPAYLGGTVFALIVSGGLYVVLRWTGWARRPGYQTRLDVGSATTP